MTAVVHLLRMSGVCHCGTREFEPGKPRTHVTTRKLDVTCVECNRIIKEKRTKAKAASAHLFRKGA